MALRILLPLACSAGLAAADLLPNGGFEQPHPQDPSRPAFWERPDGLGVSWLEAPGEGHGKAMRLDTRVSERELVANWKRVGIRDWDIPEPAGNAVAETYGISFYSDAVPVVRGQAYRVSFDWMGPPGGIKIWVRGYARIPDDLPPEAASTAGAAKGPDAVRSGERTRVRRLFEALAGGDSYFDKKDTGAWYHASHCFHPTRNTPPVTEMKVMLYAYHPAKAYWFDNLKLEPISAAEYKDYKDKQGK